MSVAKITVLGIYVADLIFRAPRLPVMGETILGESFAIGPGGKGSNQAVAAARAGGKVSFISAIGEDAFAEIARKIWSGDGVDFSRVAIRKDRPTGGAFIFVSSETGNNAIIVETGAAQTITPETVEAAEAEIKASKVFVTQLEPPLNAARRGLELARKHGVITIFNPAPGLEAGRVLLPLADFATPNESETEALTGMKVETVDQARVAAARLIEMGARNAVITLGAQGVLLHGGGVSELVPGFKVKAVDTTGAGDAFNGGFAVALAEGRSPLDAARFGNAVAALSVTRHGTAPSMPYRADVDAFLG